MIVVADIVTAVRRLVHDTSTATQRYTDRDVRDAIRLGLMNLRKARPELFLDDVSGLPDPRELETLDIDPQFEFSLHYFAAGALLMTNTQFAESKTAATLLSIATQHVTSN